jgi:predicted PhzF superfamily epimerase YddE/YHI9
MPYFSRLSRLAGRGVIVTAPGREYDFVSRCFYPKLGVNEDPVTGSAHCQLAPYWAERLGRSELKAFQASPRGGRVDCRVRGDRIDLFGDAVTYLRGKIELAEIAN